MMMLLVSVVASLLLSAGTFWVRVQSLAVRASSSPRTKTSSIVTGANGYVGRAVVQRLVETSREGDKVICLVRKNKVQVERAYWDEKMIEAAASNHGSGSATDAISATSLSVMPYDMLDGGATLKRALDRCGRNRQHQRREVDADDAAAAPVLTTTTTEISSHNNICVYHIASVFGPTDDHRQTALDNVKGTEDLVRTMAEHRRLRSNSGNSGNDVDETYNYKLVLTSSMAAVRGSGQKPANGAKYYTDKDWNTISELGANWGASYQWSKAESERRAWKLCREMDLEMTSLCPSFVFGPPTTAAGENGRSDDSGSSSGSYSLTLVGQWTRGESPVQSRLYVDIRDAAKALVEAGRRQSASGKRYIVSTEARVPSEEIATWLRDVCVKTNLSDPSRIHYDADFDGGYIPIGAKEVESERRLKEELGVELRPVKETIVDMAEQLLKSTTEVQ